MVLSGGSRISRWGGGGADPLGGRQLRCVHFLAKMYAKMKEIDPVGGRRRCPPWTRQWFLSRVLDDRSNENEDGCIISFQRITRGK